MEDKASAPAVFFLTGPTASGKAAAAFAIARAADGEIISLDSMKVYRGMDVGTAKPPLSWQRQVPYHMIDVVDPWEDYDLRRYVDGANRAISAILAAGRVPLVSGGTGLYLRGLLYGVFDGPPADAVVRGRLKKMARELGTDHLHDLLRASDPEAASRIHPNDLLRLVRALEVIEITGRTLTEQQVQVTLRRDIRPVLLGLQRTASDLTDRIAARVERMMDSGFTDEVQRLLDGPRPPSDGAFRAIGYSSATALLQGRLSRAEAVTAICKETRRFSRRQMTWLRSFPELRWIDAPATAPPLDLARSILDAFRLDGFPKVRLE